MKPYVLGKVCLHLHFSLITVLLLWLSSVVVTWENLILWHYFIKGHDYDWWWQLKQTRSPYLKMTYRVVVIWGTRPTNLSPITYIYIESLPQLNQIRVSCIIKGQAHKRQTLKGMRRTLFCTISGLLMQYGIKLIICAGCDHGDPVKEGLAPF